MIGKKILLRALEPSDIDLLYKWENDQEIWKVSNTVIPFSRFLLEQYVMSADQDIYSTKQLRLMIDLKEPEENNKTIGSIDLFDFDPHNKRAGVSILISKENRCKGYASEALELLISYAFETLNLHQLYCNIGVDNKSSLKLFHNCDFKIIGTKKDWVFYDDEWQDEFMLQLVKS
ncbi:MAG: GNAT family N-acetyltransferase [Saprospiraceae bacterium]|nr:GNAT family N-acetyltransferase [Saprospiraceae bacterium]